MLPTFDPSDASKYSGNTMSGGINVEEADVIINVFVNCLCRFTSLCLSVHACVIYCLLNCCKRLLIVVFVDTIMDVKLNEGNGTICMADPIISLDSCLVL